MVGISLARAGNKGRNFMIEFVTGNWGSLASVVGVFVSLAGLSWAIREARRARSAAQAARAAASETRSYIARHLQVVNSERAIALIQRIKLLHEIDRWEVAMEQYQPLRAMLADIIARCPESQPEIRGKLTTARNLVGRMENFVGERISQGISEDDRSLLNRELNSIQSDLEELVSAMGFGDSQGEAR